jgi:hypothetical protein
MQVEVAIFCQPIAHLWGLASDNSLNSAEISSAEPPPERPAYPRSTVGNCRGALPSTACATFRETRFVECGLAVTRSGMSLPGASGLMRVEKYEKGSVEILVRTTAST